MEPFFISTGGVGSKEHFTALFSTLTDLKCAPGWQIPGNKPREDKRAEDTVRM
jgi:hypothetical protein